ncbi:MAG: aminopeptidase P family protein [Bacteroidales bacterium]|jgi:Xaa-Pro aminopeptidase|nr:aminopeptidase P family protein [Bacteroidales bacterium]
MLTRVRAYLSAERADAIIIPSNDPHFGEYVQKHFCIRAIFSGFDGSAGTLVITLSEAALWTDSRYFIQAEAQLQGSGIDLMKMGIEGVPDIVSWLNARFDDGCRILLDGALISAAEYESYNKKLNARVVGIADPFDEILPEREPLYFRRVILHPESYSGLSVAAKREMVFSGDPADRQICRILTRCDDIMWLCNIRGSDIDYNPVALSYAMVFRDKILLFACKEAFEEAALEYLTSQQVEILPYASFYDICGEMALDESIYFLSPASSTSMRLESIFADAKHFGYEARHEGEVAYRKSIKNPIEMEGFRKANLLDGIAWCRILKYIEDNIASGTLNEYSIAQKLIAYRRESPDYRGESFEPIVAFNANAASAHYSATSDEEAAVVTAQGFLLMDTGAQYPFGTTDTTRTIPLSDLNSSQIADYTAVLKGMIQLSMVSFVKGTTGYQLDILARQPLISLGRLFFHGTGHGIGHYLCVHEGPQNIRMDRDSGVALLPGMVQSNEPAIYIEGEYGIRTENVLVVESFTENEFGTFYRFETLTLVPIATSCIDREQLGDECAQWLNNYHRRVYEKIAPHLNDEEAIWLKNKCRPI